MIQNTPGVGRTIYPPAANKHTGAPIPPNNIWKCADLFDVNPTDPTHVAMFWTLKSGTTRKYLYGPYGTLGAAIAVGLACQNNTNGTDHPGQYYNDGVRGKLDGYG